MAVRDRIRASAERLGYRPNPFVAAFTSQVRSYRRDCRGAVIALLDCWPHPAPRWFPLRSYMEGIEARSASLGYRVEMLRLEEMAWDLRRLRTVLDARGIVGVMVLPVPEGADLSGLRFEGLACATIDPSLQSPAEISRVSPDYYHNMRLALDRLVAKGYRRIGFGLSQTVLHRIGDRWMGAFLAFRLEHPETCREPCVAPVADRFASFRNWVEKERPDVIISQDFETGEWLASMGLRVPADVGVVALHRLSTTIAAVDENQILVGAEAVDAVVDAIHRNCLGLPPVAVQRLVAGTWFDGATLR
jgi:LacI family transcriptional regulator